MIWLILLLLAAPTGVVIAVLVLSFILACWHVAADECADRIQQGQ